MTDRDACQRCGSDEWSYVDYGGCSECRPYEERAAEDDEDQEATCSPVKRAVRIVFGARGQLVVGVATFVGANVAWVYGSELRGQALVRFIFHASMAALDVAAYAIVATALGYRATERVEAKVVENIEADEVNVDAS